MANDADREDKKTGFGPSVSRRSALALLGLGSIALSASSANAKDEPSNDRSVMPDDREEGMFIDEFPPGDRFGKLTVDGLAHTLQVSGTRRPSWMVQPFNEDIHTTSTSYEKIDAAVGYGVIPFPPGHVPILRMVGHIETDSESTASIRLSIANRPAYQPPGLDSPRILDEGPARRTLLEVTGQGETQVFDEVYLTEVDDVVTGLDNAAGLPSHTLLFEVKTDRTNGEAVISSATTVALELEAV